MSAMLRTPSIVLFVFAVGCGDDARPGDAFMPTASATSPTTTTPSDTGSTSVDPTDGATSTMTPTSDATTGPDPSTTAQPTSATMTDPSVDPDSGESSTGGVGNVCDGIDGPLMPPVRCDGPSGNTSTEVPANGLFSTSWFGCYYDDGGDIVQDPSDNCEFACGPQGLCDDGLDGPTCEAELKWFAADADRFGCGGRVRVTNCTNGNQVVLVTLDRGPNCGVEMDCETPVLDMSHDAMVYLFDGGIFGGCDHEVVVVEQVDDATPLGPV